MSGYVYAIATEGGAVKVGWSEAPRRRFVKVRSDNDTPVLRCRDAEQEREMLKLLAPWQIKGEWFRNDGPVAYLVEVLSRCGKPRGEKRQLRLQDRRSGPERGLGIQSSAVSQWERVPAGRVLQVERLTGISRHDLRPDLYPPESVR